MNGIKEYILEQVSKKELNTESALLYLQELEKTRDNDNRIAVIGMACSLPEATNYKEFWNNLLNERECLNYMPVEFANYYKTSEDPRFAEVLGIKAANIAEIRLQSRHAYVKDSDKFDAAFFNIAPREARYMDPSQRVFLETACGAIEDGGYSLNELMGSDVGVFVGKDHNNSEFYKMSTKPDTLNETGSWHGILASRISYIFNFRGPAMVIDTACSSGLVCVHEACRALQAGDCSMAIAGGISVGGGGGGGTDDESTDALGAVLASDSTVRPFDKKSSGTVFGEGCVALFLKPLSKAVEDGDFIHGIIRASAANNDGASNGITAPNPVAQTDVICKAWENAQIDPQMISYVETHGTGTLLGDPIEFKALNNAFRKYTNKKQFCGIGSVKSNVGHLIAASGCCGLMKIVLAMQHRTLPASLNFEEPNPHIDFLDSSLYVVDQISKWGSDDETLYAGVSSFGFSGTNVHVILESAEKYQPTKKNVESRPRALTISAKTEWSLKQNIEKYSNYVDSNPDLDIDSFAATALLGRGHYNYRLAIAFKDYNELKKKLNHICWCGYESLVEDVYYGSYKVVSDRRTDRGEGEYSESEIRETNRLANEILDRITVGEENFEDYKKLCMYYTCGGSIQWEKLFKDKIPNKLPIPTYSFERTVYWAEPKVLKEGGNGRGSEENNHPLVERCLLKSIEQDIYTTRFSVKKHWVLHDHVIMGRNILPGTAYVEIAREACSKYIDGPMELRNLCFMTPLGVGLDEEVEAQIIVKKYKDHLEFLVVTEKQGADIEGTEWVKHVEGEAYKLDPNSVPENLDLSVLNDPSLMSKTVTLAKLDNPDAAMCFGPRWDNVRRVYVSPIYKYVDARLADEFTDDLKVFQYQTSLLDEAVNAGVLADKEQMYLPFLYKSIKLYKPLPQGVYSRALCKDPEGKSDEISTYDVQLADEEGNILVDISDYSVKKVHKFNQYEDKTYYRIDWIKKDGSEIRKKSLGNVLLLGSDVLNEGFKAGITQISENIVMVNNGTKYCKHDNNSFTIGCSEDDYKSLCADIADQKLNTIVYAGCFEPKKLEDNFAMLETELEKGDYGLFMLTKALIKSKIKGNIDVIVLTDHAALVTSSEKTVKPENTSLVGVAKCITQEYTNLVTKIIDSDEITTTETILNEMLSEEHCEYVAFRGTDRYEECLVKFERTNQMEEIPLDISEGCVLITGGTGGLGIETAKYIAEKGSANICLISRSAFPDENEWQQILDEDSNKKLCAAVSAILSLREAGINVFTRKADVANKADMRTLILALEKEFGYVSAVIHCAGIAGEGFMVNKHIDTFKNVISPKVHGTKILDEVLDWNKVKLFVAFSSMTSLMGGAGQSDYTAANAYLDGFAQQSALIGKPVVTLNWSAWSETGMAVDYKVADKYTIFRSVDNKTAITFLNDAITYRLRNVVPAEINYSALAMLENGLPLNVARNIQRAIDIQKKKLEGEAGYTSNKHSIQNVTLLGKASGEYTDTEKKVAYIYAGVLDIKEIDIYDNYNALGGNSMTSTEILKILNQYFDNILDVSDVFSYPTVFEMAEYIDSTLNHQNDNIEEEMDINEVLGQFESGEIDVEKMLDFFNN